MNKGLFHRVPHPGPFPPLRSWLGVVLLGAWTTSSAQASPLRSQQVHSRQVRSRSGDLSQWTNYVATGPGVWSTVQAPPVTLRVREAIAQALQSPNPTGNSSVEYLMWRRSLDPSRFDQWHPVIGPILQQLLNLTPTSNPTASTTQGQQVRGGPGPNPGPGPGPGLGPGPGSGLGPGPGSGLGPGPGSGPVPGSGPGPGSMTPSVPEVGPEPLPIPEPGPAAIALAMIGATAWWRSQSAHRAKTSED